MGYSTSYNEARYEPIAKLIQKVKGLNPGERVKVRGVDKQALGRMRSLMYDWLSHMGLKSRFRIKTDYHFLELEVQDLRFSESADITVESAKVAGLEPLLEELIKSEEPKELVRQWVKEEKISVRDGSALLERLTEILK